MKRPVYVIILSALLLAGGIPAYADMGIPDEPRYTVAIDIYGADYYYDWDSMEAGIPDGTYAGGQKFYVWADYGDGTLQGTTNPKASNNDFDSFPRIYSSDTMRESERVSPDVGDSSADSKRLSSTPLSPLPTPCSVTQTSFYPMSLTLRRRRKVVLSPNGSKIFLWKYSVRFSMFWR